MKNYPFLFFLALASSLAACSSGDQGQSPQAAARNEVQVELPEDLTAETPEEFAKRLGADQPNEEYGVKCSPKEIGPEDIIRLEFKGKHGPEAEIYTPGGEAYFLAYSQDSGTEGAAPIDGQLLARSKVLSLRVKAVNGFRYEAIVPVFKQDGVYTLLVGTQLETELEDKEIDAYCHFVFRSAKR